MKATWVTVTALLTIGCGDEAFTVMLVRRWGWARAAEEEEVARSWMPRGLPMCENVLLICFLFGLGVSILEMGLGPGGSCVGPKVAGAESRADGGRI